MAADGSCLSQRRKTDPSPAAGGAHWEGLKVGMKVDGNETRPPRGGPWGTVTGLGVRHGTQLKCIYSNAYSMGNRLEELEAIVRQANCDLVAITETWWDCSHGWSTAMDGYNLFWRDWQERRGVGVAFCVRVLFDVEHLPRMKSQMRCSTNSWQNLQCSQPLFSWGHFNFHDIFWEYTE